MSKSIPTICAGCKHAEWKRTAKGALHPSGEGLCVHPILSNPPKIPKSAYAAGMYGVNAGVFKLDGGRIERRDRPWLMQCDTFEATHD